MDYKGLRHISAAHFENGVVFPEIKALRQRVHNMTETLTRLDTLFEHYFGQHDKPERHTP
jgi:hypothetical protein